MLDKTILDIIKTFVPDKFNNFKLYHNSDSKAQILALRLNNAYEITISMVNPAMLALTTNTSPLEECIQKSGSYYAIVHIEKKLQSRWNSAMLMTKMFSKFQKFRGDRLYGVNYSQSYAFDLKTQLIDLYNFIDHAHTKLYKHSQSIVYHRRNGGGVFFD